MQSDYDMRQSDKDIVYVTFESDILILCLVNNFLV